MNQFIEKNRTTLKLAASYLAVIMVMSVGFSLILYFTSTHDLEKRPDPATLDLTLNQHDPDHVIDDWLGRRADDNRSQLAARLLVLNSMTFVVGACLSYYLARRTLQPIEKVMRDQERFIADASHELRTPLTAILLSNEVALRTKTMKIADARRLIEQNVGDINELKTLSDELLDVSMDTREPTIQKRVSLKKLITTAVEQVAPLTKAKQMTITVEATNAHVATDKSMLIKILIILLDNAIKYSPDKSQVRISCNEGSGGVTISVIDNGMGIAAHDLKHIFERFYRTDASRSQIGGHGLGLAIAVKLVAKLHGELTVESTPKKGSTFSIWLPM